MVVGAAVGGDTSPRLTLERVIGTTTCHNRALGTSRATGDVAYAAGCVVVIYSPSRNKQLRFFRAEQPVACLSFSDDARFLAVGERGHNPAVIVWDLRSGECRARFAGAHRFAVQCLAFSPCATRLVSVGSKNDGCVHLWDWDGAAPPRQRAAFASVSASAAAGGMAAAEEAAQGQQAGRKLASAKVSQEVASVDFSAGGDYFVTAGVRHLKFWNAAAAVAVALATAAASGGGGGGARRSKARGGAATTAVLENRSAVLAAHQGATVADVACGRGANAGKGTKFSA